ncbi:hypothetical protein HNO89_000085 [Sporosarcina luteola]|nr:hypothetical protein [Sporosarcina luteola]
MTIKDGTYPNKKDIEPKILFHGKKPTTYDELPLSDPADSNWTKEFRKNAEDKTGKDSPSAYSENKKSGNPNYHVLKPGERFPYGDREKYNREFNHKAHEKWNEHKKKSADQKA